MSDMIRDVKVSAQARSKALRNAILGAGKVKVTMTAGQRRAITNARKSSAVTASRTR
jgi:hypothetical protein